MDIPSIPGFQFLCVSCEFNLIPQENCGIKKKNKKRRVLAQVSNTKENDPTILISNHEGTIPIPASGLSQNIDTIESFSHVKFEKQKQKAKREHVNLAVLILCKDRTDDNAAQPIFEHKKDSDINANNQVRDDQSESGDSIKSSCKSPTSGSIDKADQICRQ